MAQEENLYPFIEELVEKYRQQIASEGEAKELTRKVAELAKEIRMRFNGPHSAEYKLIAEHHGNNMDLHQIEEQQLYLQGVRDGIRIKKIIKEIEEGKHVKKRRSRRIKRKVSGRNKNPSAQYGQRNGYASRLGRRGSSCR